MVFSVNQILNASLNLQIEIYLKDLSSLPYFFPVMLKSMSFLLTVPYLKRRDRFFSAVTWVLHSAYSLNSEKDWPVDFAELKPWVWLFTTMCPKEQQTSDSLIGKDNCFIFELFDKFSFSGILRGRLSHSNEE